MGYPLLSLDVPKYKLASSCLAGWVVCHPGLSPTFSLMVWSHNPSLVHKVNGSWARTTTPSCLLVVPSCLLESSPIQSHNHEKDQIGTCMHITSINVMR